MRLKQANSLAKFAVKMLQKLRVVDSTLKVEAGNNLPDVQIVKNMLKSNQSKRRALPEKMTRDGCG